MFPAGALLPSLGLPFPTGSHAADARSLGAFGLVGGPLTIPYQSPDLGLGQPQEAFTNHYRRTEGITHSDDTMCYVGL